MAKMTLDELVRQLQLVYGNALRCVVLYGSAARGDQIEKRSDLNVLAVVDTIGMEHLKSAGAVTRSWREGGNPPPLTLTLAEWKGSADIFPIEYADILAHHRVLHGVLPVEGMRVDQRDLRLQLEHEAMSKLLRLRHALLASVDDARALTQLLDESVSTILVLLRATLRLVGEEPPTDSAAVLERVKVRTGIAVDSLRTVLDHARGGKKMEASAVFAVAEGYLGAVTELVRFLDRFE
jgi:hypothetical protein